MLLLNSFSNIILYATFKINQAQIEKKLCVLRAQKDNTCNGNCVLRAELKKQAENEQKESTALKEKVETVYTITNSTCSLTPTLFTEIDKKIVCKDYSKPIAISFPFFHPPSV